MNKFRIKAYLSHGKLVYETSFKNEEGHFIHLSRHDYLIDAENCLKNYIKLEKEEIIYFYDENGIKEV